MFSKNTKELGNKIEEFQLKRWTITALLSFIGAGLLGLLMRLAFIYELPDFIDYINIRHAHSHVAMLGWIFSGLYIFIIHNFQLYKVLYRKIFWLIQISILGMLIAFCVQGYEAVSISFSTMHIFLSYFFIYNVLRDLRSREKTSSILFLKTALIFLFVSTIGIWAIGPILALSEGRTAWYYEAIQFFLHFQFNGWFVFAIIALFIRTIEQKKIDFNQKALSKFYKTLTISCVLTFALAITWSTPDNYIFWINSLGVTIQFIALLYMRVVFWPLKEKIRDTLSGWVFFIMSLSIFALILKISIQNLVAIPHIATISYTVRNFVIGFIHLLMLGSISLFIIAMISSHIQLPANKAKSGIYIFLVGFIFSELILFVQGMMLWATKGFLPYYDQLLFISTLLMPFGITIYTIYVFQSKAKALKPAV